MPRLALLVLAGLGVGPANTIPHARVASLASADDDQYGSDAPVGSSGVPTHAGPVQSKSVARSAIVGARQSLWPARPPSISTIVRLVPFRPAAISVIASFQSRASPAVMPRRSQVRPWSRSV